MLLANSILLPSGHQLDYEDMHNAEKKWNPVDIMDATGRSGLCRRQDNKHVIIICVGYILLKTRPITNKLEEQIPGKTNDSRKIKIKTVS